MEENQKKQPAKRIQLVDVVLERKGSQLFSGRRVRSPEDAANIIRDFIGDSDRERFVVLGMSTKNEPQVLQVVHTGSINASIVGYGKLKMYLSDINLCMKKPLVNIIQ
ncbi:hypothetical protein MHB40_03070 [Lysinibacillus sp. FSL K6-0057]|uniref:hypothetical protein n=1 Tax=Lysinibacillus sp. FSL K6-0057 TaxID=2921411 RepID=UPI003159BFFB